MHDGASFPALGVFLDLKGIENYGMECILRGQSQDETKRQGSPDTIMMLAL